MRRWIGILNSYNNTTHSGRQSHIETWLCPLQQHASKVETHAVGCQKLGPLSARSWLELSSGAVPPTSSRPFAQAALNGRALCVQHDDVSRSLIGRVVGVLSCGLANSGPNIRTTGGVVVVVVLGHKHGHLVTGCA